MKTAQLYLAPATGRTPTDSELALVNQCLDDLHSYESILNRHQEMWKDLSGAKFCSVCYYNALGLIYLILCRLSERGRRLGCGGREEGSRRGEGIE